jgi:hypothetical protein
MLTVHRVLPPTAVRRDRVLNLTMAAIEALVSNEQLQREFPFVKYAAQQWGVYRREVRRGCCGKGQQIFRPQRDHLIQLVQQSVATLTPEKIALFKQILNVDRVIVFYAEHGNTRSKEL